MTTPVPSLKHLPVWFSDGPWHHFKRMATAALISGTTACTIPPHYCCNWFSDLPLSFSIFVRSHNQIFQFLCQFFSMWSRDADINIDTAHRSKTEKVLVFYNHVHAIKLIGKHRCTHYCNDHRCIHFCCIEFLLWCLYFQSICFWPFIRGNTLLVNLLRNNAIERWYSFESFDI